MIMEISAVVVHLKWVAWVLRLPWCRRGSAGMKMIAGVKSLCENDLHLDLEDPAIRRRGHRPPAEATAVNWQIFSKPRPIY